MSTRMFTRTTAVLLGALFAAGVRTVSADPLIVTSGTLTFPDFDRPSFRFVGMDFDLLGSLINSSPGVTGVGPLESCIRCQPGTRIDLSTHLSGLFGERNDTFLPTAQFQGVAYPTIFYFGELRFDAPTVTAPAINSSFETPHLTAPFLFSGQVAAFATRDGTGPALFTTALTGAGQVDFELSAQLAPGPNSRLEWAASDAIYRFTSASAAPTPEPATLLLVAGGLVSVQAIRRRQRQREKQV